LFFIPNLVVGSPVLPDGVTHAFHRIALQSGLNNLRLHDYSHIYASTLLKQNVNPVILAQRLGHSSVSVTMDVYSHILPGLPEKAALRFADFLTKKALPKPKN
jgi:integrase